MILFLSFNIFLLYIEFLLYMEIKSYQKDNENRVSTYTVVSMLV